jgi:DNA-binding Xre family transcriptional regulator
MSQTSRLVETLKKYLKARGITYRMLAEEMGLSETSVKRLFSKHGFSLQRLEEVCEILDLDFFDLATMMKQSDRTLQSVLSVEQEEALAEDPKLMLFLYFLVNGWPLSRITTEYEIAEKEATAYLFKLDRLGLIELHPGNKIRLLVSDNAFWRKGGPFADRYHEKMTDDFLDHDFDQLGARLQFSAGQLSDASLKLVLKKVDALIRQFNELADMDTCLPLEARRSTGLFIGFRPWVFTMISDLRRQKRPG